MTEESKADSADSKKDIGQDETIQCAQQPQDAGVQGRRIGRYRLLEELGHGGQGFVYLAEDEKLHRKVALKVLLASAGHSSTARARFEREAEAASKLNHVGIASVFEVGEHEGAAFIVFEHVQGDTLAQYIEDTSELAKTDHSLSSVRFDRSIHQLSSLPEAEQESISSGPIEVSASHDAILAAVRYIETAAMALHVAHEEGLVHRDVKPSNLMVREDGTACVLDFGLAKDASKDDLTLTRSGDLMGTPAYMSPEQLLAHRLKLDRRTDIFSLGVSLFEACTLERPFTGADRQELYHAISQKEPPSPRSINPKVPKDLAAIILTAIDKDRDRRYQTAEYFALDLQRFREHRPVHARPAGPWLKLKRWARRNRTSALAATVVLIAVVSALVVTSMKSSEIHDSELLVKSESAKKALVLQTIDLARDRGRLEGALKQAAQLFPPSHQLIGSLEKWMEKFTSLRARIPLHREALKHLSGEEPSTIEAAENLLVDLEFFCADDMGGLAVLERRLALARVIQEETLGKDFKAWAACVQRVNNSALYSGFDLKPIEGLRPLGPNPKTGLEEFLHWLSHDPRAGLPKRDGIRGDFEVGRQTGVIFVLLDGGNVMTGAQKMDENGAGYDPYWDKNDLYPKKHVVEPFFFSKYEFTEAQFERARRLVVGSRGSRDQDGVTGKGNLPIVFVSFPRAVEVLENIGLRLPDSKEWNCGARSGRQSIWAATNDPSTLPLFENLAGVSEVPMSSSNLVQRVDHFQTRAPVGSLAPNPKGCYDLSGNVSEWNTDHFISPKTGVAKDAADSGRVASNVVTHSGGSWATQPLDARLAKSGKAIVNRKDDRLGFRAALSLLPELVSGK